MSQFTTQITTYVTTTFTNAAGFSTSSRTALIALGESFCALVDATNWGHEFDDSCQELIDASLFKDLTGTKAEMVNAFAEYCINIAVDYYGTGGAGSVYREAVLFNIDQAGTADPSFTQQYDTISVDPGPTGNFTCTYISVGEVEFTVVDPVDDVTFANSVVWFQNNAKNKAGAIASANNGVKCAITATNKIRVWGWTTAVPVLGTVVGTAANDILVDGQLKIEQIIVP